MKQGSFRALSFAVSLILLAGMAVFSTFGDEKTVDLESVVIESFNNNRLHEWTIGGKTYSYDFSWKLEASKFATQYGEDIFPKLGYVSSWPMALHGTNREGRDIQSLGIWGRFDRRGYNWIDLYPVVGGTDDPFEIPLPGRVSTLDMWVWGSNLNYYIEAYFRDHLGVVHSVHMGDIAYAGWKNLRIKIPNSIPQSKRTLPKLAEMSFVKFRIWTTPLERVDNFYIYFNHVKILTDTFESLYDGDELGDPDRVQEFWAGR